MTSRGDVVLFDFPFADGSGSKIRPALVVQNDADNARLNQTILAMITGNIRHAGEPTQLLIDTNTAEGMGWSWKRMCASGEPVASGPKH